MNIHLTTHRIPTPHDVPPRQALVLFHGWGFDSNIWNHLLPLLTMQYDLFCVDLPGFGQSDYMPFETFGSLLLQQLPPRFAVLGWSLGGLFAMRLARMSQHRVSHLISVCSSPKFLGSHDWPGIEQVALDGFYQNLKQDPEKTRRDFVNLQLQTADVKTDLGLMPQAIALQQGLTALETWDLRETLPLLPMAQCYMFGRLDAIVPASTMKAMQLYNPNAQYALFKKSAHMPFLTHAPQFMQVLDTFLISEKSW